MSKMGTRIALALAIVAFAACGAVKAVELNPNGQAVSNAIGGANSARFYNSASAEFFADSMLTSLAVQREFRNTMPSIRNYSQTAHMRSGSNFCTPESNWVMWDTPFITREKRDTNDGYLGYKTNIGGFATGISRLLGESSAIGLAVGYDYRKMYNTDDYHWRGRSEAFHSAIYGGTAIGCFFFDAYAGWSRSWNREERDVYDAGGAGADGRYHGNYTDDIFSAGLKASYVWILPNEMRITPSIGLDYSYVRTNSFNERLMEGDGGALLRVHGSNYNSLQMPIMVSANKTFTSNFLKFGGMCSLWTPEIRAGWIPQFGASRTSVNANFQDPAIPNGFTSNSTDIGSSYGVVGAGLKIKLKDKFVFAIDYNYTFASKYDNHTLTGTYGVCF